MKVKHEYERMPANEVWNAVVAYINKNKQFLSSTGIKYNAKVISKPPIKYPLSLYL